MRIDISDLPEEVTVDVYLYSNAKYGFTAIRDEPIADDNEYVLIAEPSKVILRTFKKQDITNGLVASLKAESQKIRADAEVQCKAIDEKINSLLALEAK